MVIAIGTTTQHGGCGCQWALLQPLTPRLILPAEKKYILADIHGVGQRCPLVIYHDPTANDVVANLCLDSQRLLRG